MPTGQEIELLFRRLGLATENDRSRFTRLRKLNEARSAAKARSVQKTTTDNTRSEGQNAELERSAE